MDATHQPRTEPELTSRPRLPAPEAKDRPIPERRVPQVAADLVRHPWVEALRKRSDLVPRAAALLTFLAGIVSVISAVTPADKPRLRNVRHLLGPEVPVTAAGTTAAFGIALMLLSFGLRRRQHKAWLATLCSPRSSPCCIWPRAWTSRRPRCARADRGVGRRPEALPGRRPQCRPRGSG